MITRVKSLRPGAILPKYGYPGDAGMDLHITGDHSLNPGESRDLPTGIAVEMPPGYWGRITGRSSTLRARGLFVNEGVIDEGYRGELLVYVTNRNGTVIEVKDGDRLAQLILSPVVQAEAEWADGLSESARGARGFGSTGHNQHASPVVMESHRVPYLYLGGAVDIGEDNHSWRHMMNFGMEVYCPICECDGLESPKEIVERNTEALEGAADALFVLSSYSVGTPIEAWERIILWEKQAVMVWPFDRQSVFVDYMAYHPGVVVVKTVAQAAALIAARNEGSPDKIDSDTAAVV